jgi:hypothetical protein
MARGRKGTGAGSARARAEKSLASLTARCAQSKFTAIMRRIAEATTPRRKGGGGARGPRGPMSAEKKAIALAKRRATMADRAPRGPMSPEKRAAAAAKRRATLARKRAANAPPERTATQRRADRVAAMRIKRINRQGRNELARMAGR